MKTGEFRISATTGPRTVQGFIVGDFGIDRREPGRWMLTHIATGCLVHAGTYAFPTKKQAIVFAKCLMATEDAAVWSDKRFKFGRVLGRRSGIFMRAEKCYQAALKDYRP